MADTGVISKNELKRCLKDEQKDKEMIEKKKDNPPVVAKVTLNEDETSPNEYFKLRAQAVADLKTTEDQPYPHKYQVTISLADFIEQYNSLENGVIREDVSLSLAGRIHAIRKSGSKLIFYDLRGEGLGLQVMVNARLYECEELFYFPKTHRCQVQNNSFLSFYVHEKK